METWVHNGRQTVLRFLAYFLLKGPFLADTSQLFSSNDVHFGLLLVHLVRCLTDFVLIFLANPTQICGRTQSDHKGNDLLQQSVTRRCHRNGGAVVIVNFPFNRKLSLWLAASNLHVNIPRLSLIGTCHMSWWRKLLITGTSWYSHNDLRIVLMNEITVIIKHISC